MRIEEETGEEVMDIQNVDYGRVTPILTAALRKQSPRLKLSKHASLPLKVDKYK